MSYSMMPKPKKPLKDPNAKSPIQKFFGGKIPHYLAVIAFLYVLVDFGTNIARRNIWDSSMEKVRQAELEFIQEEVNRELQKRFPDTTGPVLKKFIKKKNGNGSNS